MIGSAIRRSFSTSRSVWNVNNVSLTSFNSNHALYDSVRPGFPPEAVKYIQEQTMLSPRQKVVELACGTGKFTAAIAHLNLDLLAIDPSEGMLHTFKKNFPEIPARLGDSENLAVSDSSTDVILIAQAFHWFANPRSLKEFARALKPGGKVAMIWNFDDVEGLDESSWQKQVTEYIWSFDLEVPQYRHMKWPETLKTQTLFELPYQEKKFRYTRKLQYDSVFSYWQSRSYITSLSAEEQALAREHVEQLLEKYVPEDEKHGALEQRMGTHVVVLTKK